MMGLSALGEMALGEAPEGDAIVQIYGINYEFTLPVRQVPRLLTANNPDFFFNPNPIVRIPWFQGLAEPVRYPARLPVPNNPDFFFNPNPVIRIPWFMGLSEPVRYPPALITAAHQFLAYEAHPEEEDFMGWFMALSEPQRHRLRLQAALNPAYVKSTAPFRIAFAQAYVVL